MCIQHTGAQVRARGGARVQGLWCHVPLAPTQFIAAPNIYGTPPRAFLLDAMVMVSSEHAGTRAVPYPPCPLV